MHGAAFPQIFARSPQPPALVAEGFPQNPQIPQEADLKVLAVSAHQDGSIEDHRGRWRIGVWLYRWSRSVPLDIAFERRTGQGRYERTV